MRVVSDQEESPRAQLKEKLGDQVEQAHQTDTSGALSRSGFYVFFSFDLVDATRYKEVDPQEWPLVIGRFYELITSSAEKHLQPIRLWKLVGDEVLLYKRIRASGELPHCVRAAYVILNDTVQRLHREFEETNPLLSVKGTVWCARVHYVAPQDLVEARREFTTQEYRNIVVPQLGDPTDGELEQLDFLGPDIDTGFRISKHVTRKRLVVSADMAYLLYRERSLHEPIEHQLKIVSYECLKGVWGGRRYPIVWYEPSWKSVADTFQYDERFNSEIINRIVTGQGSDSLARISGIYDDLNRRREISELYTFVANLQPEVIGTDHVTTVTAVRRSNVELHVAAVCFRQDGRALLARRPETKHRFGGKWEFGCGQLGPNQSLDEVLVKAYAGDFGAKLAFPGGLRPVTTYEIADEERRRVIPGIICVAEVTNPDDVRNLRHDEIDWADPNNPHELPPPEDCVPDLLRSLAMANAVWKALQQERQDRQVA